MGVYHVRAVRGSLALGLLGLLAGCGGSAAQEGYSDDLTAYCEAELAYETAGEPDFDPATASEEEIAAATMAFATMTLRPLLDEVSAAAPEDIAADVEVLSGALAEQEETGNGDAFSTPEAAQAVGTIHTFDLDNCGWSSNPVTAIDHGYEGVPATVDAGAASFELTNATAAGELHEIALFRKAEGVTEPIDELLALLDEPGLPQLESVGLEYVDIAFAAPGATDYVVADLQPGAYAMVCFLPIGSADPASTGPPHFTQGMFAEFTVP
ncbi:MAG: hypothetical protein ACRD0K_29885 [Egibacteraceae bacterium]